MSNNPNSQFHIPNHSFSYDGLDYAFDNRGVQNIINEDQKDSLSKSDQEKTVIVEKLYLIGNEIEAYRQTEINRLPSRRSRDRNLFINGISSLLFKSNAKKISDEFIIRNELISRESIVGAKIFGLENSANQRADFFYEGRDENGVDHWFFYQDVVDNFGNHNSRTLHYEVSGSGILLVGTGYIQSEEREKFTTATDLYLKKVKELIYSNSQLSGENSPKSNNLVGRFLSLSKKIGNRSNSRQAA